MPCDHTNLGYVPLKEDRPTPLAEHPFAPERIGGRASLRDTLSLKRPPDSECAARHWRYRSDGQAPNYPIRLKPDGSPDLYEARAGIRGTLRWRGAQIYSPDGDYTSQVRILVDQNTGEIAYVGRKADGGHNYNQIIPYPWARRP
jgi:hypothetical protein